MNWSATLSTCIIAGDNWYSGELSLGMTCPFHGQLSSQLKLVLENGDAAPSSALWLSCESFGVWKAAWLNLGFPRLNQESWVRIQHPLKVKLAREVRYIRGRRLAAEGEGRGEAEGCCRGTWNGPTHCHPCMLHVNSILGYWSVNIRVLS